LKLHAVTTTRVTNVAAIATSLPVPHAADIGPAPIPAAALREVAAGAHGRSALDLRASLARGTTPIERGVVSSAAWDGVIDRLARQMRHGDAIRNEHVHYGGEAMTERLWARLDVRDDAHVLDVCSGQGGPARHLARANPRVALTCVELNAENVERAKRMNERDGLHHRIRTLQGSAHDVRAIADNSVDGILALDADAFAYVDKDALCAEMARVLKPGGHLVLQHWVLAPGAPRDLADAFDAFCTWGGDTPTGVNADSYAKAFTDAGFDVELTDASDRYAREQVRQIANLLHDRRDTLGADVPSEALLWQQFTEGRANGVLHSAIADLRNVDGLTWAIGLLEYAAQHGIGVELRATKR
jgi:SAM-dependent methyltransferase